MPGKYNNRYRVDSARLQGFDYGQNGAYFITICTKNRMNYYGEIVVDNVETHKNASHKNASKIIKETHVNASLQPTPIGIIAIEYWGKIPEHYPFVSLDKFIVMPNHLHGILVISKETHIVETHQYASLREKPYKNEFGPQSGNISAIVRAYKGSVKSFATKNKIDFGWQSRFHDHIIRDNNELHRIRNYIVDNPDNWPCSRENSEGLYM